MLPHEYASFDAVGLRELLETGEVSAPEVEAAARAALLEVNPYLNALTGALFDEPLDSNPAGALAGVPFLIKDSGPVARGVGFAAGSRAIQGAVAESDSPIMALFRAAGFVTLGQTTAPELSLSFATESRLHGVTRNPWALGRGVGGSSGGAAALVAAGAVPVAHANDGAGSIRVPASACGLVGLKPGRGVTPSAPRSLAAGAGLSAEFAVTRTIRDAAAVLDVLTDGSLFSTSMSNNPGPLRVALATAAWSGIPVDPQVMAAAESVAQTLQWIGHFVDRATPSIDADLIVEAEMLAIVNAGRAVLAASRQADPGLFEGVSRAVLREARATTDTDIAAAVATQESLTRTVDEFFADHELLVTPTLGQLPAPHGTLDYDNTDYTVRGWLSRMFEYGPFTALFNVTGHPAISLPLGESREGLPIGVQVVAAHGRESLLLQVAAQLEQAMPWAGRQPSVFVD